MQQANPQHPHLNEKLAHALAVAGDAEQMLIGALLLEPEPLVLAESQRFLKADQFSHSLWRETYLAIADLINSNRPAAPELIAPLVADSCSMEVDEVVGAFVDAMGNCGRLTTAPEYARSVVRHWQHCELRRLALELVAELEQPRSSVEDAVAGLVRKSEQIRDGYSDADETPFNLSHTVSEYLSQPDAEVIPTGIEILDAGIRGGIRRKQFVVVGARPSVGKSALCGQIGIYMAQHGYPVMYLSCEMSNNEMTARWLNQTGMILSDDMDREIFESTPLKSVESSGWSIDRVETETRLAVARHGLSVLIVDYLGLLRPADTRASRVEQVSDITRRLKVLASQQNIVVLAAHQFNRAKEGRETARPKMSDFRDSGSVEQDADILIGLHRDLTPGQQRDAWLYVMKQRSGETSDIEMGFNCERTRFVEPLPEIPGVTYE